MSCFPVWRGLALVAAADTSTSCISKHLCMIPVRWTCDITPACFLLFVNGWRSVVKDTLEKLEGERNCFQLIGGTLVPKTVADVLPSMSTTLANVSQACCRCAAEGCKRFQVSVPPECRCRCSSAVLVVLLLSFSYICVLDTLSTGLICVAGCRMALVQLTTIVAGLREQLDKFQAERVQYETKNGIKAAGAKPATASAAGASAAAAHGVLAS